MLERLIDHISNKESCIFIFVMYGHFTSLFCTIHVASQVKIKKYITFAKIDLLTVLVLFLSLLFLNAFR